MEILVYLGLAFVYLFLGAVAVIKNKYRTQALLGFVVLSALLPMVNFTQPFHTKGQVSVYNFFFIGLYIHYFFKVVISLKLNRKIVGGVILSGLFLTFYLLHYFLFVYEDRELVNVLKDIKPFITIITAYLFADYFLRDLKQIITARVIFRILVLNLLISGFLYFLMIKFNINVRLSGDAYYEYNELRYLSLGSYFCIFYLLSHIVSGTFPSFTNSLLAIIPLLFTGNRTLLITLLFTILIYLLLKQTLKRIIIIISSLATLGSAFIVLVMNAAENSALYRFQQLMDINYVTDAIGNRISPFTNELATTTNLQLLFGKGLGFPFYIPWFHYRENIDNYNIYLDNLYLTLYAKYGLLTILCFVMIYDYVKSFNGKNRLIFYLMFFFLLALTNAVFFQYYFLWFLIMLVFPFVPKKSVS